jgi:hypothetical protein
VAEQLTYEEQLALSKTIRAANEQGWGIAVGLLLGLTLMIATIVLVLKGGPNVGAHLGLLRVYFPGYSVTFPGSLVGFVYAFVGGYAVARTVVTIYNRLTAHMR